MILIGRYLSPFVRRSATLLNLAGVEFEQKVVMTDEIEELSKTLNVSVILRRPAVGMWGAFNRSGNGVFEPGLNRDLADGLTDMTVTTPLLSWKNFVNFDLTGYYGVSWRLYEGALQF